MQCSHRHSSQCVIQSSGVVKTGCLHILRHACLHQKLPYDVSCHL